MSAGLWVGRKCAAAVSLGVLAAVTGIAVPDASGQVTSQAFISRTAGGVVPIDTSTFTALPDIAVTGDPETIATSPDGRRVYVVNTIAGTVSMIHVPTSQVIQNVFVGNRPRGIAVTPDTNRVFVAMYGDSTTPGTIVRVLNAETLAIVGAPIAVASGPHTIAVNGNRAYVTHPDGDTVTVIDTDTHAVLSNFAVGDGPLGIDVTPNGQTVYVANQFGHDVTPIDAATLTPGTPISLGADASPWGLAISPNGQWLYVAKAGHDAVAIINVLTNTVVNSVGAVGTSPRGVAFTPDGQSAYVVGGAPTVARIDVGSQTVVSSVNAGGTTTFGGLARFIGPPLIASTIQGNAQPPLDISADADLDTYAFGRFVRFHGGTLRLLNNWTTTRNVSLLSGGTIDVNQSEGVIGGHVLGNGLLTVTSSGGLGAGRLRLDTTAYADHPDGTRVEGTYFQVDGEHTSLVTVGANGSLQGYGTVNDVLVQQDGWLEPAYNAFGTLDATGVVTFMPGANFGVRVSPTLGTDKLDLVWHYAVLGGANLVVNNYAHIPDGMSFTIMTNVSGTFAGLPEGGTGTALGGQQRFHITYAGVDGNDVVITFDSAPAINGPVNQTMLEDGGVLGPLAVTIGDVTTPAASLILTATSSDQAIVPDGNIVLGGSGENRTISLTPAADAYGSVTITLTVSDGVGPTSTTFIVNVTPQNDPPTLTVADLRDYTIVEDQMLGPLDITIVDDSPVEDLVVTAASSNQAVIPDANITVLPGVDLAHRLLIATPLLDATGTTIITITVSDGEETTDLTFQVTVVAQPSYTAYAAGLQAADATVRIFDTGARSLRQTVAPVGNQPVGAAFAPDGRRMYVSQSVDNAVAAIDVSSGAVLATIPVGNLPTKLVATPDGARVYVINEQSWSVSVIDTSTDTVIETIPMSMRPAALAAAPDGAHVYVTTYPAPSTALHVIDTGTNVIGSGNPTGVGSYSLAITPDGATAYVVSETDGAIVPVDLTTLTPGPAFAGGAPPSPFNLALSPDGQWLYRTELTTRAISVISTASQGVIATINTSLMPDTVDFTPDGRLAYVMGYGVNNVDIVDVATHTITSPPMSLAPVVTAQGTFIGPNVIVPGSGNPAAPLTVADDADLAALGFKQFVPFNGGTLRLNASTFLPRTLSLLADGGTLDTQHFHLGVDGGTVGEGLLTKRGPGIARIFGPAWHTGGTTIEGGVLAIYSEHPAPVTVKPGAILVGKGILGEVAVHATALIAPGDEGVTPGIMTATDVALSPGAVLGIQLAGPIVGASYDRLDASGTATIAGATLDLNVTYTPLPGTMFTIVTNASGTFTGLPEGTLIPVIGRWLRITYTGGDGNDVVLIADDPPTMTAIGTQTVEEDHTFGPLAFTVGDGVTAANALVVTATATNATLVPNASLVLGGSGTDRTLTVAPASNAYGATDITLTVSDGFQTFSRSFILNVTSVNDPPTITSADLHDYTIEAGDTLAPLTITVSDLESPAAGLTLTATSSNTALVPNGNLGKTGAGGIRLLTVTPMAGVTGTTTITVGVSDGEATTTRTFVLTVTPEAAPTAITYYLAEGATGPFFDTDILLANPNGTPAPVIITFFKDDGSTVIDTRTLPATSRTTIRVDAIQGLEAAAMSTQVTSTTGLPVIVERTMRWDATGYGSHTEKATAGAATEWLFAEGAQGGFFSTYFLLVNPQTTANVAHVTYLREGEPAIVRSYDLLPSSRRTIDVRGEPELADRAFGARMTFDRPGVAERAMYFGSSPLFTGGHGSAGVTAPATSWFLAEGATGSYFSTFVLLANPTTEEASVTLTYLPASGEPIVRPRRVPAGQRVTVNIASEAPELESAAVATRVDSNLPIIVERAQYWPNPAWHEAHNSFGVTETATRWGLAEGRVGGDSGDQTYILLANPGTAPATATLTFLRTNGTTIVKTFTVSATSRFNVGVTGAGGDVPELTNESFGAVIESTQPIVVERSVYSNVGGVIWAAGSNATATRLP